MDETIELNGETYKFGKMPVKVQFHVARRLAPLLAGMSGGSAAGFMGILGSMAEALSRMTDEDTDYVLDKCMTVCHRKQGERWAPMTNSAGHLMFQDIDLQTMMRLAVGAIQYNLGAFFPVPSANA